METQSDLIDLLVQEWKKEQPQLDTSAIQVVGRILHLSKLLEKRASTTLKPYGIHYTDFDVLATLKRSGAPYELTPSLLMESVLITSGAMTALLHRLLKLGYIYRAQDPTDGRVKLVGLTSAGIELISKAVETRFMEAKEAIQVLDTTECKTLATVLKKVAVSLQS